MAKKPHIAVIGAGAFGGWTALQLLERGARVTLLDAWGPGNSRASSGGETRVMRGTYGPDQPYTEMAARALKLWRKYERKWKRQMLHRTGVLWMAAERGDAFERGSVAMLRRSGIKFEELSAREMKRLWPQINFEGIRWGIYEPECGYLEARGSCEAVVHAFVAEGGTYRQAEVLPEGLEAEGLENAPLRGLALANGSRLKADEYIFACGPWLGKLFPRTIGNLVRPTKQDAFFFGAPAGDARFSDENLPVWADHYSETRNPTGSASGRFIYGIPGDGLRGFKVADDTRGPEFDPTGGERVADPETRRLIREYIAFRFPGMKDAPLIESRVCQYEQTPDGDFIVDRHPAMENVWLVGGGSGHGFKHGPVLGEMLAELVLKDREAEARWGLGRFAG
jgi:glycine/D-amino acid oxidase-like deaminating enzyme